MSLSLNYLANPYRHFSYKTISSYTGKFVLKLHYSGKIGKLFVKFLPFDSLLKLSTNVTTEGQSLLPVTYAEIGTMLCKR